MVTQTQPLRDEHKALLPHIELLRTAADTIGVVPVTSLRQSVDEAYAFLTHHLLPHAQAEERALYPVVGRLMGTPEATTTMSRDHVEISRLPRNWGHFGRTWMGQAWTRPRSRPCVACSMASLPSSKSTSPKKRRSTSPSWTLD
jgi:hypothetical protein